MTDPHGDACVRAVRALASYVLTHGSTGQHAKRLAAALGGAPRESSTRSHALALCLTDCEEALASLRRAYAIAARSRVETADSGNEGPPLKSDG